MKKNLLFTFLLLITLASYGQELIKNGDFSDPVDGRTYRTIDSITGWKTDDHRLDCNVRSFYNDDAVCNQWDGAGSFYQVVGVVPAEETTFEVTFNVACTYSYWAGWNVPVFIIFSSFTGDDPTTRVPFDTLGFEFWTGSAHYGIDSAINMQMVLLAGSPLAGQKLAIEFKQIRSADYGYSESWTYLNYDDISVVATGGQVVVPSDTVSNLLKNADFSLPEDSIEHKNLNNIPDWKTDTEGEDFNGRSNVNTGPRTGEAVAWLWDETPGIYQVIGTVPAVSTKYDVSFELSCFYSWWSDYNSDFYVIFSSFTGDDPTTRVPLDTLKFVYNCGNSDWFNFHTLEGSDTLVAGNPHAGEKLVVEFKPYNSADFGYGSSYTYFWMDNCNVTANKLTVIVPDDNLIQNGDFSLPDDSVEHKNLNNIPAWKTDTESEDFNGRSNVNTGSRTGEAVAWLWDETPGIYQVIGTVPSVSTKFDVNFELSCFYSWWSDYKSDFYVIFSSFTGDDATTRIPLDTIKFVYNCVNSDWFNFHTLEGSDTIVAGNPHAGEKLVVEFKPYNSADFGYGSSYTYFWMDNCSVKASPVTVIIPEDNLVLNGHFSLPEDSVEHKNLNNIPAWKTDTESEDFNGRSNVNTGPRKGEAVAWLWDETPGIYQVIGTVPSVSTKFDVSFELSCSYSWWSDYNSDFYVIFSSFTGDDATTRVPLDTIKFTYNCGSSDWYNFHTLEGSDTIRSGHPHAGEKLVIEFKPYNSADFGYGSSYTYFWMDNVVVKSSEVIINGVEKHEVDHIKVWASDHQITVDGAREINNISVYNLMGQKVYSARPTGNVVRVPELSGFYIVVVDADHLQKSQKVIF